MKKLLRIGGLILLIVIIGISLHFIVNQNNDEMSSKQTIEQHLKM